MKQVLHKYKNLTCNYVAYKKIKKDNHFLRLQVKVQHLVYEIVHSILVYTYENLYVSTKTLTSVQTIHHRFSKALPVGDVIYARFNLPKELSDDARDALFRHLPKQQQYLTNEQHRFIYNDVKLSFC